MMTIQTNRYLRPNGTSGAATTWQRSAGAANCLSLMPLDTFTVGGQLQGQPESIKGSAIQDRRHRER
jgi:hypothetical protein